SADSGNKVVDDSAARRQSSSGPAGSSSAIRELNSRTETAEDGADETAARSSTGRPIPMGLSGLSLRRVAHVVQHQAEQDQCSPNPVANTEDCANSTMSRVTATCRRPTGDAPVKGRTERQPILSAFPPHPSCVSRSPFQPCQAPVSDISASSSMQQQTATATAIPNQLISRNQIRAGKTSAQCEKAFSICTHRLQKSKLLVEAHKENERR
uniref:Uncharacterized protein n=1 Tax=Macrostomum lignano TaxID=282301 RepID=A0A1I8FNR1_9PLAT